MNKKYGPRCHENRVSSLSAAERGGRIQEQRLGNDWKNQKMFSQSLELFCEIFPMLGNFFADFSNHWKVGAMACFVFCVMVSGASGVTYYMDPNGGGVGDTWDEACPSWQELIEADWPLEDGDIVLCSNGVYDVGGIVAPGATLTNRFCITNAITVMSVNGPEVTFIKGASSGGGLGPRAVRCAYLTNGAQLIGFTLTNGYTMATGSGVLNQNGGGAFLCGESTISSCIVVNCHGDGGGGIGVRGSAATIKSCSIVSNSAEHTGGGVIVGSASRASIIDCTIAYNTADLGGGIENNWETYIENCTIVSNVADGAGTYGGGVGNSLGQLIIVNSTISGNSSASVGGGLYDGDNTYLLNTIIINNSATVSGADIHCAWGAGCYGYYSWYHDTDAGGNFHVQANAPNVTNAYTGGDLSALATNGGFTETMELAEAAPAAGTGAFAYTNSTFGYYFVDDVATSHTLTNWSVNPSVVAGDKITVDQRGETRAAPVSMGAYALASGAPDTIYVDASRADDSGDGESWATAKKTIQAGIDAVSTTGTVWVTNGVYDAGGAVTPGYALTNRVCITNAIVLQSVNGLAVTVIKGAAGSNGSNDVDSIRGVFMDGGCTLNGFTVTNGYTMASGNVDYDRSGGGVWMTTNCTASNLIVRGNSARRGGGVCVEGAGAELNNCTVSDNLAMDSVGGGGILVYSGASVNNCTLNGNSSGGDGGGALLFDGGTLNNCLVSENTANTESASIGGGGVYIYLDGTVNNCTVSSNTANGDGDGIYMDSGEVNNCIVWEASSAIYNDFGSPVRYTCASDGVTHGTDGCITNNPLFVDAANSIFELQATSPCVNTGDNTYAPTNVTPADLAGKTRIIYSTVDMGAYEYAAYYVDASKADDSGDGYTWATAKKTIQAAVDLSVDGTTVWVTNGVYDAGGAVTPGGILSNRVVITKAATVCSVNGPEVTTIVGGGVYGSDTGIRGVFMTNGCTLGGFTITNGNTKSSAGSIIQDWCGGGVWLSDGCVVSNCLLTHNRAQTYGGGAFAFHGGLLLNCEVVTNRALDGAGLYLYGSGEAANCLVRDCVADNTGGGIYLYDGGVMDNCTVTRNTANDSFVSGEAAGVHCENSTINNSIIMLNLPFRNLKRDNSNVRYTDTTEDITNGVDGCIAADPLFTDASTDDFTLQSSSPCRNAGDNTYAPTNVAPDDLAGNPRIVDVTVDMGAYEIQFVPAVDLIYVDASRPDDSGDGESWATAKKTIQAGVDTVSSTGTVWVTNGVYDAGGAVTPGYALTNRVVITNSITLRSVNGPDVTFVVGAGPVGPTAIRGVFMNNGGTLAGFTVTNGFTAGSGDLRYDRSGGGIWMATNCVVSNLVVSGNTATNAGGGIFCADDGAVNQCVVSGNTAGSNGGGISFDAAGTMNNCRLSGNSAGTAGGGVIFNDGGAANNCTWSGNSASIGGGVALAEGTTLNNCVSYFNTASVRGDDIEGSTGSTSRYTCASAGVTNGVNGCITNNPLFVDQAGGDLALSSASPCINVGDNTYAPTNVSLYDLAGNTRIALTTVDMGAYEVQYLLSTNRGPFVGGNTITITNGTLGNGSDITNVVVGGVSTTNIISQTASSVTFVLPTNSVGTKTIVVQGNTATSTFANAYTYNPSGEIGGQTALNEWEEIIGLPSARRDFGTAVMDGKIYIAGGRDAGGFTSTSVYSFDGTSWSSETAMPVAMRTVGSGVIDTNFYVFGGDGTETNAFEMSGGSWSYMAGVPDGGRFAMASVSASNKVWSMGGFLSGVVRTNAYQYDGSSWQQILGLPSASSYGAAAVYDGSIYVVGGLDGTLSFITTVLRWNGSSWVDTGHDIPYNTTTMGLTATEDHLYCYGGDDWSTSLTNAMRYDGSSWEMIAGLPVGRDQNGAATLNGQVYSIGGNNAGSRTNVYRYPKMEIYTGVLPASGSYSGSYQVTISGTNLCNGSDTDISSVTVCGVTATVDSVSGSTQVVVTVGSTTNAVLGDVVVNSISYGTSIRSNAFEYAKAGQSITFGAIAVKTYGDAAFDPGATATSGLTVDYSTSDSAVATNAGNMIYITGAGTCDVVAAQSGNGVYDPAVNVTNSLVVAQKGLTVSGASASNKVYDGTISATISGGSLVGIESGDTVTLGNASTGTFAQASVGNSIAVTSYMTIGGASVANYTLTAQPTLSANITKADQTITFPALNNVLWTSTPQLAATSDSGLAVTFSVGSGPASISGGTNVTFSDVGTVAILADQAGDGNYNAAPTVTNWMHAFSVVPGNGPLAGGNAITITNGSFGTITNVIVEWSSSSVSPDSTGDSWVTITMPATATAGLTDITLQTSDNGDILLSDAYTYNPEGRLPDSLPAWVSLTNTWLNGTNGVRFIGADNSGFMGCAVSPAGDVNDDGFNDMLIGAEWAQNRVSHAYVVYGKAGLYPVDTVLTNTWLDGTNGMWMRGIPYQGYFGNAVSDAGDFDGDGIDDMMVGSFQYDANSQWHAGQAFVVYGKNGGLPAYIAANDSYMGTATNAVKLGGAHRAGEAGTSVSSAGDVNGDGLTDLLVGAPEANPGVGRGWAGETYLVYGSTNTLPNQVKLTNTWLDGVNGIIFAGAVTNDKSGEAVSSAGDVNGDGLDDLLIGAQYADPGGRVSAGEVYLVYGSTNLAAAITLTNTWFDGTNGVLFAGAVSNDWCGRSLSAAGDVNGDGLGDFLIGASGVDPSGGILTNAGASYLVYGTTNGLPGTVMLTNSWFDGVNGVILGGAAANDYSGVSVSAGDVNGDGLSDLLIGAGYADPNGLNGGGETYLVYGSRSGLPALISLSDTWLDGTNGVILAGTEFQCFAGNAVSAAGDYNADGYDDILIGAEQADPEGETYLVYGAPFPVSPVMGSWTGGYPVVISGQNLGASDITNVTLCGLSATIVSQVATRVWITAPASVSGLTGDVVVQSVSFGTTIRPNGFTYVAPTVSILGTNGVAIVSGEATDLTKGSKFYATQPGAALTYTFALTNLGNGILSITDYTTNGVDSDLFTLSGVPSSVAVGGVSSFTVEYNPVAVGTHTATVSFVSDDPASPFLFNLSGSCFEVSTNNGPYAGGNTITITNGNFGTITNVLVGGVAATVDSSGANWATITLATASSAGIKDILVQTSDNGDTLLRNAYTVNPAGSVDTISPSSASWTGGYSVVISGTNLCNGFSSDVNLITLAGMTAAVQNVYGSTQLVVTADASSYGFGTGDVVVVSTDYGTTTDANGFAYVQEAQTITFAAISNRVYGDSAFDPSATASSALSVSYASSDANVATVLVHDIYITGTGVCDIVASQSGNAFYFAASDYTNTLAVAPKPLTVTGALASNKVYDSTVAAALSGGSLAGVVSGDTVTLNNAATGTFAQATIGTSIAVTSYMELGGGDAGNYSIAQPALSADITAKGLTVSGASADNKTYDGTVAATITGGSLVGVAGSDTVTLDNAATGTFATAAAGTNITVTSYMTLGGGDAGNYTLSQPTLIADISKANQTIAFPAISDIFWTNSLGLAATADSGLSVSFSVGSGPAGISGGTNLTFSGIGAVSIVANQAGNANYNPAPTVTNSFNAVGPDFLLMDQMFQPISSSNELAASNHTWYGDAVIGSETVTNIYILSNQGTADMTILSVTTNGAQASSFAMTLTNNVLQPSSGHLITVVFGPKAGSTNLASFRFDFNGTNTPFVLNVGGMGLGGGFAVSTNKLTFSGTYGGSDPVPQTVDLSNVGISSYTFTNTPSVSWLSMAPDSGTVATDATVTVTNVIDLSSVNAGSYVVTNLLTAVNATNSPQAIEVTLNVAKANQTISFPAISDQVTTSSVGLTATATSGLTVSFAVGSGNASISGGTNLTFTGAGSVSIVASQAGNSNYNAAVLVTNTFAVIKAVANVTLTNLNQTFDGSGRSVGSFTSPTGLTVNITYDGSATIPTNAGSYAVTGVVNDVMYQGSASATLTVAKANQTISFTVVTNQLSTNVVGLSATASSGLPVSFATNGGPGVISGGTNLRFEASGSVGVSADQVGDSNWNAAPQVDRTFVVSKSAQAALVFSPVSPQVYLTTNTLTTTGGLGTGVVSYAVTSGPGVITNGTGLYVNSGSGVVTVVATKAWDDLYNATASTALVYVSHSDQTITFPSIVDQAITNIYTLNATASSGLAVDYRVAKGSAVLTNNVMTFTATGVVSIVASQTGDTNWNAAAEVTNSFAVYPVLPVVDAVQQAHVDIETISTFSTISFSGGAPITQRGICWALTNAPTTGDFTTRDGTGAGDYVSVARGLDPDTTYFVRSYAVNEVGTQYGAQISVTTSNEPPPPPSFEYIWNGSQGADWANTGNWSDNAVPGSTNEVIFYAAGTTNVAIDLSGTRYVGDVILNSNVTEGVGFYNGVLAMTNEGSALMVAAGRVDFESAPVVGDNFLMVNLDGSSVNLMTGLTGSGAFTKYGAGKLSVWPFGPVSLGGDMTISNGTLAMWGDMHLASNASLVINQSASLQPTIMQFAMTNTRFVGELVVSNDVPGSTAATINGAFKPMIFDDMCTALDVSGNTLELGTGSVLDVSVALGEVNVTGRYTIATYSNRVGQFSQVNGLTAHTLAYGSNSIVLEPTFVWEGSTTTNWSQGQSWTNSPSTNATPGTENDAGFVTGGGTNINVNVDIDPSVRSVRGLGEGSVTLEGEGEIILTNNAVRTGESPAVGAQEGMVFIIRCELSTVPGARFNALSNVVDAVIRIEGGITNVPGEGDFTLDGGGRVELLGTNTFGSTTNRLVINGARLFVEGDHGLGHPDAGLVFTNGGTLNLSNDFTTGRSLEFAGDGEIGTGGSNSTVTITNVVTGVGRMRISGDGTVVLSASNLLGGAEVGGGTLRVEGHLASEGNVGVSSNAVLGGNGTIELGGSAFVVHIRFGAACAPGASIGTITVDGSMTVDGSLDIEVENSSNDVVVIRDTLTLNSSSSLKVVGEADGVSDYEFATFSSRSGKFGSLDIAKEYVLNYSQTNIVLAVGTGAEFGSTNAVREGETVTVNLTIDSNTAWTAVSTSSWITVTSGASGTGDGAITLTVKANEDRERSGTVWIAGMKFVITQQAGTAVYLDFDGDAKADVACYWPEYGTWYILESATMTDRIQPWGWANSSPVAGDYDGDGKYDVAVYNAGYGMWYILQSETMTGRLQSWGWENAVAVPADYDGDGVTDVAVYDPNTGSWHILQSSTGTGVTKSWGWNAGVPVPGDYDGDGKADVAVYWPEGGQWYILQSSDGQTRIQPWGWADAEACQGDYDGDGKTDVAVYWPETGWWNILQSSDGTQRAQNWGWNMVWPVPADYDGDEKYDVTVYWPIEGYWYIWQSQNRTSRVQPWGWNDVDPVNLQFWLNSVE